MSLQESVSGSESTAIRGTPVHRGAIHCTSIYVIVARAKWPKKTAENWAIAAGVKPRMVKYWMSSGDVSPAGKLAIFRLLD